MNHTGHYTYQPGQGWVKVDEEIPTLARPVYVPKGDLPNYVPSARRQFESKAEKRQWLKANHLREGGIITNSDKRWNGPTRNATKPSWDAQKAQAQRHTYIQSQGGTQGLLDRIQQGKGHYV